MGKKEEISMEEAIISWHTTVFLPAIAIIEKYNIIKYVKNRTTGDLYIWLADSLHQINEKFGAEIKLETFVADIKQDYKWSLKKKIQNFKNKCLLRIKKTSK